MSLPSLKDANVGPDEITRADAARICGCSNKWFRQKHEPNIPHRVADNGVRVFKRSEVKVYALDLPDLGRPSAVTFRGEEADRLRRALEMFWRVNHDVMGREWKSWVSKTLRRLGAPARDR